MRELARVRRGLPGLDVQSLLAGARQDQVDLDVRLRPQPLQQTHSIDDAARARDADNDSQARIIA